MESKINRFAVSLGLIIALLVAMSGWLDQQGYRYTQAGLQRALVTFAISRTLNGVISVAQGTEVAVEPVGIGMTFTPGQILDPVNDLIERFSTVVLVAGTAFGAQHVLLDVGASQIFTLMYTLATALALLCLLCWHRINRQFGQVTLRLAITLMFVRLAVPSFAIGGELFYQQFLEPQYQESSEQLQRTKNQLDLLNDESVASVAQPEDSTSSFFDGAKRWMQGAESALDWKAQLAEFSAAAETVSEHAIRLMVVFVFQTVLLPLMALWLIYKLSCFCFTRHY